MLSKWRKVYEYNKKRIKAKGEIAHFEQFLLFSQCFHKSLLFEVSILSMKNMSPLCYS